MKCKTLHKKLIFFLEGDLSIEEIKQFEKHLSACPNCAAFALEMKSTLGIIEMENSAKTNPFFYTRVKAKLEDMETKQESIVSRPVLIRVLQPVAFSIILLLGVYAGIKIGQPFQSEAINEVIAEQEMIPYLNEMAAEPIETFLME